MRSTQLVVNLSALKRNVDLVKQFVGNKEIIAVVKADAYGLGSVPVTKALIESGISFFSVALLEEAAELRNHGINQRILLLAPFTEPEIPDLINLSVIPSLVDLPRAKALNDFCNKINKVIPVHVKVDTGMGRLGFNANQTSWFIEKLLELRNLNIEGIYSHFPSADIPDIEFTQHQISLFSSVVQKTKDLMSLSHKPFIAHLSNSSGIIAFPKGHFDGVRPGIMLYGCHPSPFTASHTDLSKVITLKTEILSLKELEIGDGVSYGRTFIAKSKTKIAVLPVGYGDGYSTLLSNCSEVIIKDMRVPVIGRVCMDYTIVDVTTVKGVEIGDEAILIGKGITEEEIAKKTGLIPYEILTGINKRVPRNYILY